MDRTDVGDDVSPAPGSERGMPERLEDLPWVGRAIAAKLRLLGIERPKDLLGQDPYELHRELAHRTGRRPDPVCSTSSSV
jgi:nucleotidyltransferase/DNA polymerase involved in DNA repair